MTASRRARYCVWEITLACDLGCVHCGSRAGKVRQNELTTEEALDVVAQLAELGFTEVTLIGGEAYLRDDWDVIARAISDAGMLCGVTTGARQLTRPLAHRMANAGVRSVSISVDGLEATHDALRGAPGSWRAAVEGAHNLRDAGVPFGFNTQVNRLSLPELAGVADLLVDSGGMAWQVQLTVPMGRAADRPDLLLQPWDLLELFPLLVWLRRTRLDPAGVELQPGNNVGYRAEIDRWLRPARAPMTRCGAGESVLGLEADGTIKGCPSLPTDRWRAGSVRTHRLSELIDTAEPMRRVRDQRLDDLWGFCRGCEHASTCGGGCTWTAEALLGRPGNNPWCIHRVQELDARGIRERLVHEAPAPGRPFDLGTYRLETEPVPLGSAAELAVGGLPLEDVISLRAMSASPWSARDRARALRRAPGSTRA